MHNMPFTMAMMPQATESIESCAHNRERECVNRWMVIH